MIITYHKESFIKVQQGDLVVAFNPISREVDAKATRFGADLCLVSLNEPSFNGCETVTFGNKEPFVVNGPGEYEIDGIFIYGLASEGACLSGRQVAGRINTIFATEIDGLRLCHLGGLANANLDPKTIEDIGGVDILFMPIGEGPGLTPREAAKLATSFEPRIIVPLLFENGDNEEALKIFAKDIGGEITNQIDKLTLKRKDLEGKEAELIIIKAS